MYLVLLLMCSMLFSGCYVPTTTQQRQTVITDEQGRQSTVITTETIYSSVPEPWAGYGSPWYYNGSDWYLNGSLYYYYGFPYFGWWPSGYYSYNYVVKNNYWYGQHWNHQYHNQHWNHQGGMNRGGQYQGGMNRGGQYHHGGMNRGGQYQGGMNRGGQKSTPAKSYRGTTSK